MSVLARTLAVCLALALLGASGALAAGDGPARGKSKAPGKSCKKGWKLKTITKKNGDKVKVCRKKKTAKPKPKTPTPAPAPAPAPGPAGLFEAPGKQLEGEAAKPFLQRYLLNSTFTDCPAGWPACGGFENRYSHSADNTFYKCLLRPVSGSDVKSVGEYGINNARIEADGSWIFQEVISWYGEYTSFEWKVSQNGVVEGAQSSSGGAIERIGPLQYVGGVAKNCSY